MLSSNDSSNDALALGRVRGNVLPVVTAAVVGILAGIGGFTFVYGKGAAYLSNDPRACISCHVMQGHFDSWQSSGHHHVAVCNDCHLPPGFIGKWFTKADNGFLHSLAFTTGDYPDPLRIKPRNSRRTQAACIHCHEDLVHSLAPASSTGEMPACAHCHGAAGHALR